MLKYTKHQIKRIRDLNDKYFEVVFNRRGLKFVSGSTVTLYNGLEYPIFITSGIQEAWLRIILKRDLFSSSFPTGKQSIKLNMVIENVLPDLMDEEKPSFVFDTETIGAFFSWASSNIGKKCKVCYLGDNKIQESWIRSNHIVTDLNSIKKVNNLYVTGNRDLFKGNKSKKLLNTCKRSFLI